jgi:hypothetical protein
MLGNSIAFNHYKNGSLKSLSMRNALINGQLHTFLESVYISDKDHEIMFGDKKVANEMEKEKLEKKLQFGLTFIDFKGCNLNCTTCKLKDL